MVKQVKKPALGEWGWHSRKSKTYHESAIEEHILRYIEKNEPVPPYIRQPSVPNNDNGEAK